MKAFCYIVTFFVVALAFVSSTPQANNLQGPNAGNWTVGDCILVQFAMEFSIHLDNSDQNQTLIVDVPANALVDESRSKCGASKQTIVIVWSEPALNDSTVILNRSLTIDFSDKPDDTYYGVSHIVCEFDVAAWNGTNAMNETSQFKSSVTLDSGEVANLMFHTPLERSFLCADLGHLELPSVLNYPSSSESGTTLSNSTVLAKKVQFDAFRTKDRSPPGFRTPMDCDYKPNDIVPIAVGVALALLVITVLISYLVGRRRHRQRGYQSV